MTISYAKTTPILTTAVLQSAYNYHGNYHGNDHDGNDHCKYKRSYSKSKLFLSLLFVLGTFLYTKIAHAERIAQPAPEKSAKEKSAKETNMAVQLQDYINRNLQSLVDNIQDVPARNEVIKNLTSFTDRCSMESEDLDFCMHFVKDRVIYYVISTMISPYQGIFAIFDHFGDLVLNLQPVGAIHSIKLEPFSHVADPDIILEHSLGRLGIHRTYQTIIKHFGVDKFAPIANILVDKYDSNTLTVPFTVNHTRPIITIHYSAAPFIAHPDSQGNNRIIFYSNKYEIDIPEVINNIPSLRDEIEEAIEKIKLDSKLNNEGLIKLIWDAYDKRYKVLHKEDDRFVINLNRLR